MHGLPRGAASNAAVPGSENKYLKLKTLILCFDKIQVFEPTKIKFYK